MGTFVRKHGKLSIPEEKKGTFLSDAASVSKGGGLFTRNFMQVFGKKLILISFPDFNDQDIKEYDFTYSYYEDDSWENAGIHRDPPYVYSEKIGWRKFNLAVQALYILAELYSDTPYITCNDSLNRPDLSIQWLRYVLKRELHYTWRKDIWSVLEMEAKRRSEYTDEVHLDMNFLHEYLGDEVDSMSLTKAVLILNDLRDFMTPEERENASKRKEGVISFPQALITLHDEIEIFKKESTLSEEEQTAFLFRFLNGFDGSKAENKELMNRYFRIMISMVVLPAPTSVRVIAEVYGKNFWSLWWQLKDQLSKEDIPPNEPVLDAALKLASYREMSTEEFFNITSDDRLYWWRKDGDVELTEDTKQWLKELKKRYDEQLHYTKNDDIQMWQKRFVNLLVSHPKVYCFEQLFFEFMGTMKSEMIRAAVILMEETSDNIQEYRRLMAVMGNRDLRYGVFLF